MTTMTTQRRSETAREFLLAADREFAAGDVAQGSEKLWGAASQAVIAVAQERGWKYGSHRDLKIAAERIAGEENEPLLSAQFATAEKFHANFYHQFMDDFQLAEDPSKIHDFVNRVLALLN